MGFRNQEIGCVLMIRDRKLFINLGLVVNPASTVAV